MLISDVITLFHPHSDLMASQFAMKIRMMGHQDLMDCWIAASAVALNAILLTEDTILKKILKDLAEFKNIPIWNWNRIEKEITI
jgi:predicted nucleic acid-binding protein